MPMPQSKAPNNLRAVRTARGMSLEALSRASGVSMITIGRIEREQRAPMYEIMIKISRGLRVSPLDIWPELGQCATAEVQG